jgi:N-dimethylarginine dimethylaminohydrolase
VLIEATCNRTAAMLEEKGFVVRRLETSEFLKAGGSVFCMKLALS